MPNGGHGKGVMKRPGTGKTPAVPAEETVAANAAKVPNKPLRFKGAGKAPVLKECAIFPKDEEPRAPEDLEIRKLKETIKIMRIDIRKNKATIKDNMAKIKALEFELNIASLLLGVPYKN